MFRIMATNSPPFISKPMESSVFFELSQETSTRIECNSQETWYWKEFFQTLEQNASTPGIYFLWSPACHHMYPFSSGTGVMYKIGGNRLASHVQGLQLIRSPKCQNLAYVYCTRLIICENIRSPLWCTELCFLPLGVCNIICTFFTFDFAFKCFIVIAFLYLVKFWI